MEELNVKEFVRKNIYQHSLKKIKNMIKTEYKIQLNAADRVHIEKKYIECCLDCLVKEIGNILNEMNAETESDIIEKFVALENIKHFNEISSPFDKLKCYKLLIKYYPLIIQRYEESLIKPFKETCMELLYARNNNLVKEIDFLEALIEFLNMFEKDERYPDMSELRYLCGVNISNCEFFQTIRDFNIIDVNITDFNVNDVKLKRLQDAAQLLMDAEHVGLMRKYKEIIRAYFKPINIKRLTIDKRTVIELTGGNIRLSEIANCINLDLSRDPKIEEVRFISSGIIYVDVNFENSMWHGKNIVMYAKAIRVCDTINWDVSGKSAEPVTYSKAGTACDGNGISGKSGKCGESGGNVLIHAANIFQPQRLFILSNGGDGSDGQSGGDARDGRNGTSISYNDFVNKFPVIERIGDETPYKNLKTVARNIKSLGMINVAWKYPQNCTIDDILNNELNDIDSLYIEAQTAEGHKIYVSFSKDSFVHYQGSLGQLGGHGGIAGSGGPGGYSGEVISNFDINVTANKGRDGKSGKAGKHGNRGQNGWDIACANCTSREPMYYGTDENSILKKHFYSNYSSNRIYVPYHGSENNNGLLKYMEILSHPISNPAKMEFTKEEEIIRFLNFSTLCHIQAERKKNISRDRVFAQYSQHLIKINIDLYRNFRARMKDAKKYILDKIMENNVQQEKEIPQKLNITRVKSTSCQNIRVYNASDAMKLPIDFKIQEIHQDSFEILLKNLQRKSLDDGFKLENMQVEYSNFYKLCELQKKSHSPVKHQSIVQNIEQLLIKKYRLAILQKISMAIEHYQFTYRYTDYADQYTDSIPHTQITAEKAIKYLLKTENNSHINLNFEEKLMQRYFCEDDEKRRRNISKVCTGENFCIGEHDDAFRHSIRVFVMEEGKMEGVHPTIKKYYEAYNNFLKKQNVKLQEFFERLKLEVGSHDEITVWLNNLNNPAAQDKLKNDFRKNKRLNLYDQYVKLFNVHFNWDDCYNDQKLHDMHLQHIRQQGPLSSSCRELLAHIFGISIYVYTTNHNNEMYLLDIHNSQDTDSQILYLLYTDKGFVRLQFNERHFKLDMRREEISDFYTKIIDEVESLKRKEDCDEYLEKELFFSKGKESNVPGSKVAIDEEGDISDIIQLFSSVQEQCTLRLLLEKLSKFTEQCGIVHAIAKCFSCHGRHLTYPELYCLINTVLSFVVEDRPGLNIFCWIIMAYPQHQWLNEIIMLKLENYFQKLLTILDWRKYLKNIKDKETILLLSSKLDQSKGNKIITVQCIDRILHFLCNISEPVPELQWLELSEWLYIIKEKYWLTKLRALTAWEDEELQRASYYLLSLENAGLSDVVHTFVSVLTNRNDISSISKSNFLKKYDFFRMLLHFRNGRWIYSVKINHILMYCAIGTWMTEIKKIFPGGKDHDISDLCEMISSNDNTSAISTGSLCEIKSILEHSTINETMSENMIMEKIKELRSNLSLCDGQKLKELSSHLFLCDGKDLRKQYVTEHTVKILNLIDNAIQLKRNFRLRDMQKLAILTLLWSQESTLMQVSTGEGKSLITVVLAIFKVLCGQKVDIVTTSSILAKRDAEDYSDIYELFSISVSNNCRSDAEGLEVYSCKDVIYGDLVSFQRDYLLDQFYDMNIRGDRTFDNVLIDEVDSMLLDKGNNICLRHALPDFDKLESVYVYIWQSINKPITSREEFAGTFDNRAIKHAILHDMYGSVTRESISKLDLHMREQQVDAIWEHLIKNNIINSDGYLLQDDVDEEDIKSALSPDFEGYARYLVYLFKSVAELRERQIHIPDYLKSFVALHLDTWISSAKTALFMQEGTNYTVDVDRKENKSDNKVLITIIDRDTGVDHQTNSNNKWDKALHQFLQLKHGCKLSMQHLKTIFISSVSYLKLYRNLYCLTGTLGSHGERSLLQEIYRMDFVSIPTAKIKKFYEGQPIVCSDLEEWSREIYNEAKIITVKRSILIICETVKDVKVLCQVFSTNQVKNVHTHTRDYEPLDIATENKRLCTGQIIIATNLASRGIDIRITDKLNQAGGLHVCLTYLPTTNRIEQQVFGLATRYGKNGSSGLIIQNSRNVDGFSLKKERDFEEIRRISHIKLYYNTRIRMEEDAFRKFKEEYARLKDILKKNKATKEITDTLLRKCLDEWALWLDANSKYVKDSPDEQNKQKYEDSLHKLIKHFEMLCEEKLKDEK